MLGVAVVGLGVGREHALAYLRTHTCKLRWVYDLDRDLMRCALADFGEGSGASSFEAILNDEAVDIVSVASYDDAHFAHVVSALSAGKHVFVEKPLCRSVEELVQVKKVWQANCYRHLWSNLVLRTAPVYQWLRDKIHAGDLGRLYALDADYLYGRLHKITEGWRKNVDNYSVMQGGGIHLVDLMLWLTGQKPTLVSACGNRICTNGTEFRYKDFVSATYEFASGLIARITANFGSVHRHQHVLRIFGTEGTFIYDDQGPRWHTSRDPAIPSTHLELSGTPSSKGDLIPAFVQGVLAGKDTRTQSQHEFDVISACVAVDEALATRKTVAIVYV